MIHSSRFMESPCESRDSSRRASGAESAAASAPAHRIGVSALRAEQTNASAAAAARATLDANQNNTQQQQAQQQRSNGTNTRAAAAMPASSSSPASASASSGAASSQPHMQPPQHSHSSSHASSGPSHGGSKPRRTCLLIVDVQNDFVSGSLCAPNALEIIPVINSLRCAHAWDLVVFTGDAHPEEHVSFHANHVSNPAAILFQPLRLPSGQEQVLWPIHCVKDTWGAALHTDLVREPHTDIIVEKGVVPDQEYYSAFKSTCGQHHTNLESLLHEHRITDVVTCGLVYEYCVGNTSIDSAHAGFKTFMLTDATKSLTEAGRLAMQAKLLEAGVTITASNKLAAQVGMKPQRAQSMINARTQGSEAAAAATVVAAVVPESCASGASTPVLRNTVTRTFSTPQATAASYDSYSAAPTRASSGATAATSAASTPALSAAQSCCAGGESQSSSVAPSASPSAVCAAASSSSSAVSSSPSSSSSPRPRVLLGLSGSVATIKVLDLLSALQLWAGEVRVVATSRALHFVSADEIRARGVRLYTDDDEWNPKPWKRGDPVMHVELRRWADLLVIAPLSANTLAKLSHGLCDNLLSTLVRAWDWRGAVPLVLAPAMNTMMWDSPLTARQLSMLTELSPSAVRVVSPVAKVLACGDVGTGAMAAVESVAQAARKAWEQRCSSKGYTQAAVPESMQ